MVGCSLETMHCPDDRKDWNQTTSRAEHLYNDHDDQPWWLSLLLINIKIISKRPVELNIFVMMMITIDDDYYYFSKKIKQNDDWLNIIPISILSFDVDDQVHSDDHQPEKDHKHRQPDKPSLIQDIRTQSSWWSSPRLQRGMYVRNNKGSSIYYVITFGGLGRHSLFNL